MAKDVLAAIGITFACVLVMLVLCVDRKVIPDKEEFYRIRRVEYTDDTNHAVKAEMYADHLHNIGVKCWVVSGIRDGQDWTWVTFIDKEGVKRLCDPSTNESGVSGKPESRYTKYKPKIYKEK